MSTTTNDAYLAGLNAFYAKSFGYLTIGMGLTTILSFLIYSVPALFAIASNPIVLIGCFIALIVLAWKASPNKSASSAWAQFLGFATLSAFVITPYAAMHTAANVTMAFSAAVITSAVAGLYGYTTKKDLSKWGGLLMIGFIAALIVMVINMFIGSSLLSIGISLIVIPLYLFATAYDVQMLREMYDQQYGDSEKSLAIFGALILYINIKGLFIHILNFLGVLND